ncbi:CoA transferase subunit A [Arvimicrobium flavum]|uniref:CoA transferase subunit A n=1 Tax=Arvimicrobium flavum TaxID=3393320 RepID=UPI00237A98C6|nr:3-oxoacid CoA-transferase subunit A [Mesorhizobium shangrilense]
MDKHVEDVAQALSGIADGASVLVGGFGAVGQPNVLLDALGDSGVRNLTVIANNAGFEPELGLGRLIGRGCVSKMICSFPRGSSTFDTLYRAGKIELEVVPQGTLAERIRAGGAGIPAFYTPTAVGTQLAEGKETRVFNGRTYLMEQALTADVAIIEAWNADRWGNLTYRGSGRNFNPIMAMAGRLTIVQAQHLVPLGSILPDDVVTPGIFVNRVVHVPCGDPPVAKVAAVQGGKK